MGKNGNLITKLKNQSFKKQPQVFLYAFISVHEYYLCLYYDSWPLTCSVFAINISLQFMQITWLQFSNIDSHSGKKPIDQSILTRCYVLNEIRYRIATWRFIWKIRWDSVNIQSSLHLIVMKIHQKIDRLRLIPNYVNLDTILILYILLCWINCK